MFEKIQNFFFEMKHLILRSQVTDESEKVDFNQILKSALLRGKKQVSFFLL